MKEIPLSRGLVTIVDDEDYELMSLHTWYATQGPYGCYAARYNANGPNVRMHRELLDAPEGMLVDHINGDTLDNRKSNLRLATASENSRNRRRVITNKTGAKGVSVCGSRFKAQIWVNGSSKNLGRFLTLGEAAAAYQSAAKELHREFAWSESKPSVSPEQAEENR